MDKDKFNEAAKKIISDKEYPEAEDILKLVEGSPITDNHERRIHDPSIYKYRGRQVLHTFFDEPYPMPGVTIQRVMSSKYFLKNDSIPDSVREEAETVIPRETITIDSMPEDVREKAEHDAVLYGDSFVTTNKHQTLYDIWIEGISDPKVEEPVVLEGITQSFKMNLKLAKLKKELDDLKKIRAIVEDHDVETFMQMEGIPDTMENRAFVSRFLWYWEIAMRLNRPHILNRFGNMVYFPSRCNGKKWFASHYDEFAKSISITSTGGILWEPETDVDLNSVIYMTWPKPDLSGIKVKDGRFTNAVGNISIDYPYIMGYATDFLKVIGSDLNTWYGQSTTPNLNNSEKKALERLIKKARKHK